METRRLETITLHPLRSAPGVTVPRAHLSPAGLAGDRRWQLLHPDGSPVTLTAHPALTRLRPRPEEDGGLTIADRDGGPSLRVPVPGPSAPTVPVPLRDGGAVTARAAGGEADAWLGDRLGFPVRLVRLPDDVAVDRHPLLLVGTASLAWLAERLGRPAAAARFRPNLVVATREPWEEERWSAVRIGPVACAVRKVCPRCPMVTVDPETGARDPAVLEVLAREHATAPGDKPGMGVLLAPRDTPAEDGGWPLATGDPVVPL